MARNGQRQALVTGGAGFIGSHLCEALLARDWGVICLDNFQTGAFANVAHLAADPAFKLIEADITRPMPARLTADLIFNLACAASPQAYQRDPIHTWKTSVLGAMHLLERAEACGARRPAGVDQRGLWRPRCAPADRELLGQRQPGGSARLLRRGQARRRDPVLRHPPHPRRPIKVARIFNTYGPRMHAEDGRIISNFVVQGVRGEPLTVYGDGRQTRSFCYVDDMVRALLALADSGDGVVGPVNLGNPDELPVIEVARRVLAQTARMRASSSIRCRSTIRGGAGPRSIVRSACLAGDRWSISTQASPAPLPISRGGWDRCARTRRGGRATGDPERARTPAVVAASGQEIAHERCPDDDRSRHHPQVGRGAGRAAGHS